MKFTRLGLPGAYLIEIELVSDDRGFFARSWCEQDFTANGLDTQVRQCSISFNSQRGTLRGMHYQAAPREESKVVRCTQGAVFDVLLDLRPDSPTYCHWAAEQLSAHNHRMVYVPRGVAHGFQTLTDNAEVFYQISQVYDGDLSRGVRWNDPAFEIDWPEGVNMISERDRLYPDYKR